MLIFFSVCLKNITFALDLSKIRSMILDKIDELLKEVSNLSAKNAEEIE